ncbi:hypothetical protein [Actinomadura miaoliensis]|uniref:Tetratricopeptide repeat protein n=1 Tax=Actinomadura miaoliensis TaxID=430685 RepID=A0ABP7W360_9ACTN
MLLDRNEIEARLEAAGKLDSEDGGPGGEVYVEAMRDILPHAEALGDPDLLMHARLGFTWATLRSDREAQEVFRVILPVLRRCLLDWHAAPHRFRPGLVEAMWNQFFNICDCYVRLFPEPARRIHRFLDELERYCPPTRRSTRYAIDQYRMKVEARRGDRDAVERLWRELRAQGEPEEHFHLDGKIGGDAFMWQRLGRDDRAVEVMAPVLAGQIEVRNGRNRSDALLLPYLRAGRLDEAVAAHQSTYTRHRMRLEELGAHLQFCALTGNEERGLDVLDRNVDRFFTRTGGVEWLWTAAAAVLLCRRVMEKDLDRQWFRSCECDESRCHHGAVMSYADLGARLRWAVVDFSLELDEMDESTFMSEQVSKIMHAEPIMESLALPPGTAVPRHHETPPAAHLPSGTDPARALDEAATLDTWTRFIRLQRLLRATPAGDETDIRLALLDELMSPELHAETSHWRHQLFATLAELARSHDAHPSLLGADRLDRIWRAVPFTLDSVLTHPTVHAAQIRGLLRTLEPHCRPGTDDLHHLRWFAVELQVRRGDLDAARAAWAAFADLPASDAYTTRPNILRRTLWWLDLGCDDEAVDSMALLLDAPPGAEDREDYLLLPYLRAGRLDRAREVHERTYRTALGAPELAAHLEFCARTGELDHGRELIQRHLGYFHAWRADHDCPIDRVRAYGAAARLSDRLVADGLDETWTRPADECCEAEDGWSYARFAASTRFEGDLFVTRWDELMGTTATRTLVARFDHP